MEDDIHINTGLGFGAQKGNSVVKPMMQDYGNIHFLNNDRSYNMLTYPVRNTASLSSLLPSYMERG